MARSISWLIGTARTQTADGDAESRRGMRDSAGVNGHERPDGPEGPDGPEV